MGFASHEPAPIDPGGRGMRGFRLIRVVGVATVLLCTRSAVATQSVSGVTQSNTEYDAIAPSSIGQATAPQVVQRALANAKSSRPKPRRTRPVKRTSGRPKSVSQRTRQVGKEARIRSVKRLKNNKARAKQRIKRTPVAARRRSDDLLKRPPLVRVKRVKGAPAPKASTEHSSTTPKRRKPKAEPNSNNGK